MGIRSQRKMTRQKQGSSVPKTDMKWKPSQKATVTRVIGAEVFTSSETVKLKNPGLKDSDSPYDLKMVGKKVLVEEEPIEATPDKGTGLTQDVCDAIKSGLLVLSDQSEFALMKFPFRGTVLSAGGQCKYAKVGDRIHFAPLGVQRFQFRGKQFLVVHEDDIHGFYV